MESQRRAFLRYLSCLIISLSLIVVKGDGVLIEFNTLFDIISSANLDDNDETFLPGQEITPENSKIEKAQITWKSDSRVFAINYSINGGYKCLTRDTRMEIIKGPARADKGDKDINVRSVSEKPILEMKLPVAMMPSGSLVAGFQVSKNAQNEPKHEIIFWEKNGLRHGEIELPKISGHLPTVTQMKFNIDTTFLAVLVNFEGDRSTDPTIPHSQILIMHRSNYHWFIKKSIGAIEGSKITDFIWSANKKNQLTMMHEDSMFSYYEFQFVYHTTNEVAVKEYDNISYTANVDFTKILLTPLGRQVIPPPMSEKAVKVDGVPDSLYFSKNYLFALLRNKVALIDCITSKVHYVQTDGLFAGNFVYQKVMFIEKSETDQVLEGTILLTAMTHKAKSKCHIHEIHIQLSDLDEVTIINTASTTSNRVYSWCVGPVQYFDAGEYEAAAESSVPLSLSNLPKDEEGDADARMAMFLGHTSDEEQVKQTNEYQQGIYMQYLNKNIQVFKPKTLYGDDNEPTDYEHQVSHLCYQIEAVFMRGVISIITLSNNGKLSINGDLFSADITSLFVSRSFIFFINGTLYLMYVYNLNKELPKAVLTLNDPDAQAMPKLPKLEDDSFHVRNIERGARIVCCNKTKTVLQMPRGNLEGIRHRIPLLYHAETLIESAQYGTAFAMLRKHKIDMNLICDINYDKFKANISLFVDQNLKVDSLNLFITSLKEEESRELEFLKPKSGEEFIMRQFGNIQEDTGSISKINEICDLIREELNLKSDEGCEVDLTLPILTTYVKKSPQELKQVLYLIKSLKNNESGNEKQIVPPHLNQIAGGK